MAKKYRSILIVSLITNVMFFAIGVFAVNHMGGILYIKSKFQPHEEVGAYYADKVGQFEEVTQYDFKTVFAGDSHFDNAELSEIFGETVVNRGIQGDTVNGVLNRLSTIAKKDTEDIFFLVGINDIQLGIQIAQSLEDYKELIKKTKTIYPESNITIVNLPYVNSQKYNYLFFKDGKEINKKVKEFNDELKELSYQEKVDYLDINSKLSNNAELDSNYTTDGLHLNVQGYHVLKSMVSK